MPELRYKDSFTEAALEEFLSVEQTLEQDYGLGTAFYEAMQRTVDGILEFPEMMRVVHESTRMRRVSVAGFPHNVFYRIEAEFVVIYAVAHQSRKPLYWVKRLPPIEE